MKEGPYRASLDEVRAIDEALAADVISDAKLPAYYCRQAARLRDEADKAEAVEMRVTLLEMAEQFDRLAAIWNLVK